MANRVKEDEKNERIIRSLLKLPDNRRCINCKSLGPQYVCTNFWTFICTNCSGIHREFTHRVKSVSMAKFTSQEVSALQGGGNASAKEIYLKEWDPERNSLPDSSNVERLRTFIKHVYVDRRYTGERSSEKPPRAKTGDTEDSSENRKMDSYRGGSRSPQYNDTYERRYTEKPSPGGRSDDRNYRSSYDERRSPGSDSDYGRSPVRTEIVNDWRRDDRFGNGKKSEDGSFKVEVTSPDSQKDLNISSPPVVRPVRDILGENVSPLRVIEPPPKANGGKSADALVYTQRTASSSSLPSSNGNVAEVKVENSLIDFDAVPEPPVTNAVPTAISSDNWANFDSFAEVKVSQVPSNANLLESVLSDLMVPAPISGHTGASASASGNMSLLPPSNTHIQPAGYVSASHIGSVGPAAPINNSMAFPPGGIPSAASGQTSNSFLDVASGGQWNPLETHQQFSNPPASNQSPSQPFVVGGASSIQVSRAVTGPLDVMSETLKQPSVVERTTGKRELPEDLFTANYSPFPAPMPGWHAASPHGFASNMQYSAPAPVPTYSLASKSSNPFEFNNEPTPVQASLFPSMMPLQGALPSVAAPAGLPHNPSSGATQAWMPQQFSHQMTMTSHAPNYASAVTPSPYTGQPVTSNTPPRPYGATGFGYEQNAFSSLAPNQQPGGLYAHPASQNSFSSAAGNPFG